MLLKRYKSAKEYLKENEAFLLQEEAVNSLLLGLAVANKDKVNDETLYLDIRDSQGIQFSAIKTKNRNLIVYGETAKLPQYDFVLLEYCKRENISIPGVIGPRMLMLLLEKSFQNILNWDYQVEYKHLVYSLTKVVSNPSIKGKLQHGKFSQIDTLAQWMSQFYKEALNTVDDKEAYEIVQNKINKEELYIWNTDDIVSMTCSARPTKNGITINYVFSPKEHRRKGYATKIVAEVSALMLKNGHQFCTLFADPDNPTSNNIYRKIGYHVVGELRSIKFKDGQ